MRSYVPMHVYGLQKAMVAETWTCSWCGKTDDGRPDRWSNKQRVASPCMMRSVVVFPAPFGPNSPKHSPCPTVRYSPSTASRMQDKTPHFYMLVSLQYCGLEGTTFLHSVLRAGQSVVYVVS